MAKFTKVKSALDQNHWGAPFTGEVFSLIEFVAHGCVFHSVVLVLRIDCKTQDDFFLNGGSGILGSQSYAFIWATKLS